MFWVRFPRLFTKLRKEIMSLRDDVKALIAQMDTATNLIAARIQKLIDQIAGGVSAEDAAQITASLQAEVVKLQALGADPVAPVPASALEPDQETTPILDAK